MKIIGLTGGVASGKNFIAEIFAKEGCAIFDADFWVHELLSKDLQIIQKIAKNFPESLVDGKIERKILGKTVFASKDKLQILEEIIHPKVQEKYQEFLQKCREEKIEFVVLNIPLLLESNHYKCDFIIAIITSESLRLERFIAREKAKNPQILIKDLKLKFTQIVNNQIDDSKRRKHANFIIENDGHVLHGKQQVEKILREVRNMN